MSRSGSRSLVFAIVALFCMSMDAAAIKLYRRNPYQKSEDTTQFGRAVLALSNPLIGDFLPMYDDGVDQVIRMCSRGKDIAGALEALQLMGVYLGNSIDSAEEATIVRISTSDINALKTFARKYRQTMVKKPASTIGEINAVLDEIEAGNGKKLLDGMDLMGAVGYEIRDGISTCITLDRLALWIEMGSVDKKKFTAIHEALLLVGLKRKQDDSSVRAIVNLTRKHGDVVGAIKSLRNSGWSCQGSLDDKEVAVIAGLSEKTAGAVRVSQPADIPSSEQQLPEDETQTDETEL